MDGFGIGTYDENFHSDPIEITFAFGFDQTTLEYPKHIKASMDGTILVTSNNRIFVFGANQLNSLALGETPYVTTPYEITDLFAFNVDEEVEIVKSRALSAVLVTSENRVFTWGCNFSGELGIGYPGISETVTEITDNVNLQVDETIIDANAGNTLIIITSLGRFLFAGERQIVPGFRPLDNIYPITDLTYVFTLNEGEYIAKLVDTNSYSKSVLTSSGRVLAWGQLYNLGMGTTNDWEMVPPSEINLVYLTSLHVEMYEYGEVITLYVYSKDGYDFVGWYSDDDLSVEFDFLIEVTSDIIIYGYYVLSE